MSWILAFRDRRHPGHRPRAAAEPKETSETCTRPDQLATARGTATGSATSPTSPPTAGPSPAAAGSAAEPPSVFDWYANRGIRFAQTEVSDRKIADLLTGKMNSPVIYVPQLAEVPPAATSKVYIFSNGVQPEHRGPLGFQGDVFPTAPGDAKYSPLRSLVLVTWKNPRSARRLRPHRPHRPAKLPAPRARPAGQPGQRSTQLSAPRLLDRRRCRHQHQPGSSC